MSKVKLLLDVIQDIRSLADSLQAVADAMLAHEPEPAATEEPQKPEPTKKDAGKKAAKPGAKAEPEPSKPTKPTLTLEQVRAVLAEKSRAGHTTEIKALLLKHGADKLSDIDPEHYVALLADAEVL
ncbi:rRNA biogenesis protein rrp5 [Lactonifactor longoviformis]|uniref:rRNA biogenesis protein rrp5 n=1 Tax=Lactonifactor longoviformis TaxID=341220 RepID=UPI0036F23769